MSKKQFPSDVTSLYCFCGEGTGIPGLPHEVTAAEAEELGLLDVLQAAIQNGNYKPVQQPVGAQYIAPDTRKE